MVYRTDSARATNIALGKEVEAVDALGEAQVVDVATLDNESLEAWILAEVGPEASQPMRRFAVAQIFTLLGRSQEGFSSVGHLLAPA